MSVETIYQRCLTVWQSKLGLILLAGLMVRLLLMPFFAHSDLMTVYWRSHLWVDRGQFEAVGFQLPMQYLHALFLWGLAPALGPAETIWPGELDDKAVDVLSSTQDWKLLISQPHIYRTLFLFKLPYLAFDLGCLLLIIAIARETKRPLALVLMLWWLNPIVIFGIYIYSRHEVIAQFFILASLLQFICHRQAWAIVCLGIAVTFRFYPILLLPFYLLPITSFKRVLHWGLWGLLPFVVVELYSRLILGHFGLGGLVALPHLDNLLSARVALAAWDDLYIFPLAYLLLILHRASNSDKSWETLADYSLLCMLIIFALAATGQSPHYWVWLIPWLILAMADDPRLIPLHYLQCVLLLGYSFLGERATAGYLLGSLSPDFFWNLPSPIEIVGQFLPAGTFISLSHTALTAVTLWMIYLVFTRFNVSLNLLQKDKQSV